MNDRLSKSPALGTIAGLVSRSRRWHWVGLLLLAVLSYVAPTLVDSDSYVETILVTIALFAVLALSADMLLGRLGLPSIAHGALFAVGAYTVSVLTVEYEKPFWSSVGLAVLGAAFVGLVLGVITMRATGHYFALSSLAFAGSIVAIITAWSDVTRGAAGIFGIGRASDLDLGPLAVDFSDTRGQYYLALTLLLGSLLLVGLLDRSDFGRRSDLIKADTVLAGSLGVNVFTAKLKSFVISAAMAGAAGALYASFVSYIDPSLAHYLIGFNALVYCIVGGAGRLLGPLIGTIVVIGLGESLRITDTLSQLLFGVALILILLFMKEGVAGAIGKILGAVLPTEVRPAAAQDGPPDLAGAAAVAADQERTGGQHEVGGYVLEARDLTKSYGGVRAVENVSINVRSGEIVGVMGPNGAGKSTVFGMIAGTIPASGGQVHLEGSGLRSAKAYRRARRGIGRTFQTNRVLVDRTVLDNVRAARLSKRKRAVGRDAEDAVLRSLLSRTFLADRAHTVASELTVEEQRLLGVAMALAIEPKVLLLDEPFAGLRDVETPRLQSVLENLRRESTAVILVEHKLKVLMALSDRVYTLDRGRVIAEGPPHEVMQDEAVIDAYLGRAHVAVD